MTNQPAELQFEVNLLFTENKTAIEAFNNLLSFYEILNDFDKSVVRNIGINYVGEYGLEDIEFSSIRTKLVQLLKATPDEIIKNLDIKKTIGYFLVKVKYRLIKLLEKEKDITSKNQIQPITDKINEDIKEIGITLNIMVTQVNNYVVLNAVDDLAKETNKLKDKESLEFKSMAGNASIQKGIFINKPKILAELGQRTIVNETTEILKIKKVDLLSEEPKWDFLQGKRVLNAKMLDKNWLDDFHKRNVIIKPEDALMVTLKTTHTYSPNFDDKKTDCEITKVLSVISPDSDNGVQMEISEGT
ncbi:MAG: hypothetical protein ABIN67_10395 [Ferruginibacter sp.]